MGQRLPYTAKASDAWLSNLIETFDQVEARRSLPCDPGMLCAMQRRLQRPAGQAPQPYDPALPRPLQFSR